MFAIYQEYNIPDFLYDEEGYSSSSVLARTLDRLGERVIKAFRLQMNEHCRCTILCLINYYAIKHASVIHHQLSIYIKSMQQSMLQQQYYVDVYIDTYV